jgi:trimeric autotransporter adhesin
MAKCIFGALVLAVILYGCGGGSGGSGADPATLVSIAVSPATALSTPGLTTAFLAKGTFSDGSVADLTAAAGWSSSNPSTATVSNLGSLKGVAAAVSAGGGSSSTVITATSGGFSGSATLTVAALQSIAVGPASPAVLVTGDTQQFTATGSLTGGLTLDVSSQATWTSSNPSVATVSTTGLVTAGASPGTTQISASFGGFTSNVVSVTLAQLLSIALSPASAVLDAGGNQQFSAVGTFANAPQRDITRRVTWSSSVPTLVSVNANGTATALAPGTALISASLQSISEAPASVTVLAPTSIAVAPANASMFAGSTQQFTATGTFADGGVRDLTNLVTWSSQSPAVAVISNASGSRGLATAANIAGGSTVIVATLGNTPSAVSGSTAVSVTALTSLLVAPNNPSIGIADTLQLTATGGGTGQDLTGIATWSSSAPSVATVSNTSGTKGLVTGVALGSATITATVGNISSSATVAVSLPPAPAPANRAYVANFVSNNLSVIDTVGNTVVATIPVGSGPQGVALNPAANRAYVANNDGTLTVVDIARNSVVTTVNLLGGGGSWGVAVLPGLNRAYVANSFGRTLSVVNTLTNTLVANINVGAVPRGVTADPGNNLVYVANSGDNSVSVVNAGSNLVAATVANVGLAPQDVALHTVSGRAYLANSLSNLVSVLSTSNNSLLSTVQVGTVHQALAVNPLTNRLYVTNDTGTVSVLDTTTNTELGVPLSPIAVGSNPRGIAVRTATNQLFVTNFASNTVTVVTTASDLNRVSASIQVGSGPRGIAVLP